MGRFAPVMSIGFMERALLAGLDTCYHLPLAHKILAEPDRWRTFCEECRKWHASKSNGRPFFVMDNSLIELGEPLLAKDLYDAACIIDADCIVLPDRLRDFPTTIGWSRDAANNLRKQQRQFPLLGVVQGNTEQEYMLCAEFFTQIIGVNYLSVPRVTTQVLGSRIWITEKLAKTFGKAIHLLGFSGNVADDIAACVANRQYVIGIDSAVPIRMGQENIKLEQLASYCGERPKDWLELEPEEMTRQAMQNMYKFNRLII